MGVSSSTQYKLSEHFNVKRAGDIEGFMDLGNYITDDQKGVLADYGMIVLLQPFTGSWTQALGVFASRGNVKTLPIFATLAKIIAESTILAEQANLYVVTITCDRATWNRSM
ncbi:hypothetical protein HPB49_012960 [Dermacentor silvarum]|uniref:Uncharacterized protein n=1 Tax=Dermacentor silvarum TaxID=543639 RepID=A0ACB8D5H5_DERSI|nr:hypothetical protein HPB49_012960 [Dermacentor silvarum]